MGKKGKAFKALVRKSEGKRPLRRQRRILGNNIKTDHKEIGRKSLVWILLAQDSDQWPALVKT
jgi:hypothetical protein